MYLRTLLAGLIVTCAATVAHAGAVYGTSATSTIPGGSDIVLLQGSDSNMDGAQDGSFAYFRNNVRQSGAETFTVDWDVSGAGDLIEWRLWVYNRTTNASVVGITLTDNGGLTAVSTNTQVINPGPVSPGTITPIDLTNFHSQSDYTAQNGFNWGNVQGLQITFQLNNPDGVNDRALIRIDAVSNPEPGTLALFGLGVLGLGFMARRRRRVPQSA